MTMPASQEHLDPQTPFGATVVPGGTTFRTWAPNAKTVYISGDFNGWKQGPSDQLVPEAGGYWAGFVPAVGDGNQYKFWVVGKGNPGYKRDPYARELTSPEFFPGSAPYPNGNCVVRDPARYPWHDHGYHPPAFNDLVIYQFHVGTFYSADSAGHDQRAERGCRFLDALFRIEYLAALGVNAIQPLPIVDCPTRFSLGYNVVDLFSPEMVYGVPPAELTPYVEKMNELLASRGQSPVTALQLENQVNQLKALIDVCHVWGLAVILDVVYNHAGGGFDDESLYFFDRQADPSNNNNSLYFTDQGWAGGLSFALWNAPVRQFLIDNANCFIQEYHADGLRYDEVSALVALNRNNGWSFCQDLTATLRFVRPDAIQIAEYWPVEPSIVRGRGEGGAGFDATWHDGLRDTIRGAIAQASVGQKASVDMDAVARSLSPGNFSQAWKAVQCLENHDIVYKEHAGSARVAALGDPSHHRSWYARSRARVANGLLLTAPGIPMLFMGQEFLEDKVWSDDWQDNPGNLIWWGGLDQGDTAMVDHLRFTRELIGLRRRHPALRGERINAFYVHSDHRVLAFHRWVEGMGRDIVVVASLNESTFFNHHLGFPLSGRWLEVFNSDIYDHWVNPWGVGNGGAITAVGGPMHGFPASAAIVIPANSVVVFALDPGD